MISKRSSEACAHKFRPQLVVALDVDTLDEAKGLVDSLGKAVDIFKVGSQLFTASGPEAVRYILRKGKEVFLDLKFHDIPSTAANAVRAAVGLAVDGKSIFMCTLHTLGGRKMLECAVEAASKEARAIGVRRPFLVGVTVLTSEGKKDNILPLILERAGLAKESGLDGVVASSDETAAVRQEFGRDFIIVTPGIRPKGTAVGDQKRVATPAQAVTNGSHFLVVGRPIVGVKNPLASARQILEEIHQAHALVHCQKN